CWFQEFHCWNTNQSGLFSFGRMNRYQFGFRYLDLRRFPDLLRSVGLKA
ncbi:hypothetical protein A2U01_0094292, partial [Trifolium medium]|nr:hypothetical protein [Trifolium medium]